MNCRSAFKTLILCQLSDNRSFQSYSQLSFPSLVGPPHNELHYSSSQVGLLQYEKYGSAILSISFSGESPTFFTP